MNEPTEIEAECICCLGDGHHHDSRGGIFRDDDDEPYRCPGCHGQKRLVLEMPAGDTIEEFCDGPAWDQAVDIVKPRGGTVHDDAYTYAVVGNALVVKPYVMSRETAAAMNAGPSGGGPMADLFADMARIFGGKAGR
jgi:hypothetical protein